MASANFLEEALKSDVDESAVNAIVGTLENQLDANTNQVQQVESVAVPSPAVGSGKNQPAGARIEAGVVSNGGTSSSSNSSASPPVQAVSTGLAQQQKKHGGLITNGEIVSNSSANHSAIINNNTITTNNNNLGKTFVVNASGTQTAVLNMNNNRVTLTPSSLPNGTLTMSQQPQLIQTNVVATGGGTKTITGTTIQQQQAGQPGQQQAGGTPQTIIIKNSSGGGTVMNTGTPGIVTVSKPINNQVYSYTLA
uniref:Uncharacterized protein n=1 Tax=Anopheles culicifacies TaxID=139723 RepID=A0A182MP07_9DIPT